MQNGKNRLRILLRDPLNLLFLGFRLVWVIKQVREEEHSLSSHDIIHMIGGFYNIQFHRYLLDALATYHPIHHPANINHQLHTTPGLFSLAPPQTGPRCSESDRRKPIYVAARNLMSLLGGQHW